MKFQKVRATSSPDTHQYRKTWRWPTGNHPCLVLVEWELLLIRLGWPMTEQTGSCLFSGSVTNKGKNRRDLRKQGGCRAQNQLHTKVNKPSSSRLFLPFHFLHSTDAEEMNVMPTSGDINHLTRCTAEPYQPYHLPPLPRGPLSL